MDESSFERFKARLDETQTWPSVFVFKFIVPRDGLDQLVAVFRGKPISMRPSKHGKYVAITAELMIEATDQVVSIYRQASKIRGVIAL